VRKTWIRFPNEESVLSMFPEVTASLTQETVRYCWALLKTFNKHFGSAVPYIRQHENLAEMQLGTAIPMSIAAYMNCVK